jgi:hypothetical protein
MVNDNIRSYGGPLLLETDQTDCYNDVGKEVECRGSGQDGEMRPKPAGAGKRFDIRNDIIKDRCTDLTWSRNASPAELPMTWAEAFDYVSSLNDASYSGIRQWRLPFRRELYSLISYQYFNPALPGKDPFTDVFSGYYWTASPASRLMNQAWYIHLGGGRVYRGMKDGSYMVWPVAGSPVEEHLPTKRFNFTDNILRDHYTKRMWLKQDNHLAFPVKWNEAFDIISEMKQQYAGGYSDWRLPNIRELESLVDLNRHSPALKPAPLIGKVAEGYWSSTTSVYEKRYAWVLYTRDGAIGVGYKPKPDFCVYAIRNFEKLMA